MKIRMLKITLAAVLAVFLFSGAGFAASVITPTVDSVSFDKSTIVIKLSCTAHIDGTFDSKQILSSDLFGAGSFIPVEYQNMGYFLYEVWAVNPASVYPTTAAAVTLTDENGVQVLKSGEMLLSTSASGIAEAVPTKYRAVNSKLTIAIGDTGSAANTVTIYVKLSK